MKVKQQQSSNITIAPNIYVRTSSNLQSDEEFVKKVYGHKALNILKSRFPKSYTSRFTRAQIEEMKQNVICRHGKIREHAYGKASWGENVVWSCRCENITCHAYEKCMSLPNAMRIDRKNDAENFSDTNGISIVENETGEDIEYGFNPDDCVFAPPHVAVVLPILEKIISEGEDESIDTNFVIPDFYEDESAQENNNNPNKNETVAEFTAEKFKFDGDFADKRVLVICENMQEAGYYSTILYKHKVKHRFFKSEGCTLNRRIADVFWDYCGDEIEKETFFMRCAIRTDGDESETLDFYDALFDLCGDSNIGDEGGLHVSALADALNNNNRSSNSPNPGEPLLNLDDADYPVTVSTLAALSSHLEDEYDEVMVLLGETTEDFAPARFNLFSAVQEVFGSPPLVIHKESAAGWVFATSG
ncbi:MAG: hypothetical protein FWG83_03930, partial [Oscillospiraceae bacterium]|nr:hypothetical protein [Oscillospiraceae bacterium]